MKQGKPLISLVILAMAAVIAVYLAYYVFDSMDEPYQIAHAYAYTAYDSVAAEGLVVRQAVLIPSQPGILEVTRAEGEKVGKGQQIALVYRDTQAQADQAQIEALQMETELLEYAIAQGGSLDSAARLDEEILQAVADLRASYALGDCTQLWDQVMDVKSGVLKRGYTYGEGLTSTDLSDRLRQLSGELSVLTQQSARATTRISAPVPGVFSNLVDGYESRLTPETVLQLTPSSLQALIDDPAGQDAGAMGKLITSNTWSFAACLSKEAAGRLEEGGRATLRFSGELARDVEMQVDKIGPTEGDRTLVVFSSDRYLTSTTLLRHQTAELIFHSYSGLRIPKEGLRLVETAVQDKETGETIQVKKLGAYALVNGRAEFREASIVHEGSDYYVVRPVGSGPKILRAGDSIIIHATGLQEGLLLEG